MVVSAQPVAPSAGTVVATFALFASSVFAWNGQDPEATMPLVLEVLHLHVGVVPIALDQRVLRAQHIEHRVVLQLVQLVRIHDAEVGLLGLEVQRRVGEVDRAVVCLHAALVGLAVRQLLRLEDHRPRSGRLLEDRGAVQQDVRPPLVRHAIVLAVDEVPRRFLQPRIERRVAGNTRDVDGITVPPRISRSDASPEAVTRSYGAFPGGGQEPSPDGLGGGPPDVISATISSEVLAILTFTLQPVSASNFETQS
jgi:hypothetical protein